MAEYAISRSSPDWMDDLPRDYKDGKGEVVEEAGVHEKHEDDEYWKVFQLIERNNSGSIIRSGYYKKGTGWTNTPLTLPPEVMEDLTQFAEGKIW